MLVSCIMPTANRRDHVRAAIACFMRQDYSTRELVIVDDGEAAVADLVPRDARVRYVRIDPGLSLGEKRNRACELAVGALIMHWDDDDWYPPTRITRQVAALQSAADAVAGSSRIYFHDRTRGLAWEYRYQGGRKPWVAGSTLAYSRELWQKNRFRDMQVGEDSHFVWNDAVARVIDLADASLCIATVHGGNTSIKRPSRPYWSPVDVSVLERARDDAERSATATVVTGQSRGRALVAAAGGIGDIVRITPLIAVLHQQGFGVDVVCGADYAATAELLSGARQIERVIPCMNPSARNHRPLVPELAGAHYDVACFTWWAQPLQAQVNAHATWSFERAAWLRDGDSASIERIARELGWTAAMPAPFVVAAARDFALPPGTLALHPGCKKNWPWKKWHGFVDVAAAVEHVVVIGTEEDLDVAGTYFGTAYDWPPHVRNFVGQLPLQETAALVQQCAALVCNDSGMQHIAAAVGTPAYPIYGITNPQREVIPISTVRPISGGLPCEPECRRQPWGRRDCDHHLECLKTMSATEVIDRIRRNGIELPPRTAPLQATHGYTAVPAETVTVAAVLCGGIGDLLLASPLLERVYDELKGCTIDVFYHVPAAAAFVFNRARFVRAVHPSRQLNERHYDVTLRTLHFAGYTVRNAAKLQRVCPDFAARLPAITDNYNSVRGLAERHPSCDGLWGRISVAAGRNILDSLGHLSGLAVDRHSELFLAPEPAAFAALDLHLGGCSTYVTVHDGFDNNSQIPAGTATKCWPIDHWQAMIAQLKARYPDIRVVQLGAERSRHIPGVDHDLVGRTSLHESACIIKNALLHIDTDSGLVHIARAVHTPAIAMFGPTDHGYYGHAANTNIAAPVCGNCWWSTPDWLAHCPRGMQRPACMDSITPAAIMVHVDAHVRAATQIKAVQDGPVIPYDGALCATHRATFLRMCEQLDLPVLPISEHIRNNHSGVYIHASKQWEYLYAIDRIESAFPHSAALHIADLGGGRGALAPFLAHAGHNVEVFDTDYLWDHEGDTTVEFRYREWARNVGYQARFGSIYNVPAASAAFDVVTCISVVEHVPHKTHVLREALRLLRPGGLLVLTFDFANDAARFEDGLRPEIFDPERLARTLAALDIDASVPSHETVDDSARRIQLDGVRGIPAGMTVAGLVLRRTG